MKSSLIILILCFAIAANAQYYYKDIIGTKETTDLIKNYRNNKVSRVVLNSYDAENTKVDDFYVEQVFSTSDQMLRTISRSGVTNESLVIILVSPDEVI